MAVVGHLAFRVTVVPRQCSSGCSGGRAPSEFPYDRCVPNAQLLRRVFCFVL
jgi:hypothetical protein